MRLPTLLLLAAFAVLSGCAAQGSAPQTSGNAAPGGPAPAAQAVSANGTRTVKSRDGSFDGEITGYPAPRSKFARLQIGMSEREVTDLIGQPTDTDSHITGKSFIPFYFGGDTHRLEAFYKGEGYLTFSPEHFAGQANTLIAITVNPNESGYSH